ncbi:amidohydrolase [Phreatobacter stygius]|uniref:Amidohydrolase n=1 Tax=Phreatobacter stygius TaxID=1940610 RepID=A0A4D7B977_9HYPH|nr:amidohydrolase [Phreatobacter stygius]QCI66106.1 amidohydrolase [Phreatobacter stygius]
MSRSVDLVLHGGRIATFDDARPFAQAIAVAGGRILAVGSDAELAPYAARARQAVDLKGCFALPGLVDSHCHPDGEAAKHGRWQNLADLHGDLDTLLGQISRFDQTAPRGRWFLGYRYDENALGGRHPDRAMLDAAAPGRPVFLLRRDAHVGVANTAAFAAAGIDPAAGHDGSDQVDTDAAGLASGVVRGRLTQHFVRIGNSGQGVDDFLAGFPAVMADIAANGITGIHNALTAADAITAYRRLHTDGALPLRVAIMADGRDEQLLDRLLASGERFGSGDEHLRMLGVEFGFDGSTGGRTAAYYQPYRPMAGDTGETRGFVNYAAADMADRARAVRAAGLQFCLTGNGDRGIDLALDAIEASDAAGVAGPRPRVEHCCCMPPATQERFARTGATVSSAAAFLHDLGDSYLRQRPVSDMAWLWPHRSMMARGALVCAHSDAPVCGRNPFTTIAALVTRRTASGAVIAADQALGRVDALRTYTVNPAIAAGLGDVLGSLAPGRLADVTVVDTDLLSCPDEAIGVARAEMTIVAGKVVFDRQGAARERVPVAHG